jgi:hypothetical protein
MMDLNGIIGKLGGKKLMAAIAGVLVVLLQSWLGFSPETAKEIVGLLMTYIIGQSVADGWSKGKTSSTAAAADEAREARDFQREIQRGK